MEGKMLVVNRGGKVNEKSQNTSGNVIDREQLPELFPTHRHLSELWERVGRVVATFGFLEEILGKAIYAYTAMRQYSSQEEAEAAYGPWLNKLQRALSDPLSNLADSYGKAVRDYADPRVTGIDEVVKYIKKAAKLRNALCHGSWRPPDVAGKSAIWYFTNKGERFETLVDNNFLRDVQRHVVELTCAVIDSVTLLGWQFPGGTGPGKKI